MYKNYGDRNFLEYGLLVDTEHSDTRFDMLICRPYDDIDGAYIFGHITVDIEDSWINWKSVYSFCGIDETTNSVDKAIAAYEYYGPEEFGIDSYSYDWREVDVETIERELHYYLIDWDGVVVNER